MLLKRFKKPQQKQAQKQTEIKEKYANIIFYMQLTKDYTLKIGD